MRDLTMQEMDVIAGGGVDQVVVIHGENWTRDTDGGGGGDGNRRESENKDEDSLPVVDMSGGSGDPSSNLAKSVAESWGIGVKAGVNMENLGQEIVNTFASVATAFANASASPVITSANDGRHMAGSQHYSNQAIDLRANNISESAAKAIVAELKQSLGSAYFIQYESFPDNPTNNHIHIQTVK